MMHPIWIKYLLALAVGIPAFCFFIESCHGGNKTRVQIQWTENLPGDFDFRTVWSYPEGVYRNDFGQLDCDGFCPEGANLMKDSTGKIVADSMKRFYQLVDTSHQFHSFAGEAECDEWAGTDFATAQRTNKNTITCFTQMNAGTHCSLILDIFQDACCPRIELSSISSPGIKAYYCQSGYIKIDTALLKENILKAEFNFDFKNLDDADRKIYWKGKLYTGIRQ